jgi:hypothetical protein
MARSIEVGSPCIECNARYRKFAIGVLVCAFIFTGCSTEPILHDYTWSLYEINPALITADESFLSGNTVSVSYSGDMGESMMIGSLQRHQYNGSSAQLAEAVSIQLSDELKRLKVNVVDSSDKSLVVSVSQPATVQGAFVVRASMRIRVETGNGYVLEKAMSTGSPGTVPLAFNGLISLAVVAILNDPQIVAYIGS